MRTIAFDGSFSTWRAHARAALVAGEQPGSVAWHDLRLSTPDPLFGPPEETPPPPPPPAPAAGGPRVAKAFVPLAETVACHRDPAKWGLLYRLLARLAREGATLLEDHADDDVRAARVMEKAIRRDAHKMHAFVRFREVPEPGFDEPRYVAFHRPDHLIVRRESGFFRKRFPAMRWSILTPAPGQCVHWDTKALDFRPGLTDEEAVEAMGREGDGFEEAWLAYYRSVFNPARVMLKAMRAEMPLKHWATLPETKQIPEMLAEVPERLEAFRKSSLGAAREPTGPLPPTDPGMGAGNLFGADEPADPAAPTANSAAPFVPEDRSLGVLAEAAKGCRGCPLFGPATQVVFGVGPQDARVVLVGEQPGDNEDLQGKPFIGPAGRKLDGILERAGVDRSTVYVTNAVKHFKFEPRGKRRIHAKPAVREITACMPWLEAELEAIGPAVVVALGATAARALFGAGFKITKEHGEVRRTRWAPHTLATYHPSAILRAYTPQAGEDMEAAMVEDLSQICDLLRSAG